MGEDAQRVTLVHGDKKITFGGNFSSESRNSDQLQISTGAAAYGGILVDHCEIATYTFDPLPRS